MKKIAVAKGDGIGPEIMDATLHIFNELNIPLKYEFVDINKENGLSDSAKVVVEELGILFKGPMETPKGKGARSLNVTARKMWATYANCRVFKTLPGVETIYSKANIPINLTIIRENLEDTYGGVEHLINPDLAVSRRFTSVPGAYQIHKYAFEYAKANGIASVVCGHKANIMKLTDGLFLEVFYEVAKNYPEIKASDVIVDDLCMKMVTIPDKYELIVLPNLQGDIVSDLCAGLVGGLGFAPSANIGDNVNIFEAVHGTAPDIAGQNKANPTALLLSGLMMLNHFGFAVEAKKIEIAMLQALKNKIHTADLKISNNPVGTKEYATEIAKIAKTIPNDHPELKGISNFEPKEKKASIITKPEILISSTTKSTPVGIDVFVESNEDADKIAKTVISLLPKNYTLEVISNRGISVYPTFSKFTQCINSYIVRIKKSSSTTEKELLELAVILSSELKVLSLEILKDYDGRIGYSAI
jgi:isocitrate dehydrogenase